MEMCIFVICSMHVAVVIRDSVISAFVYESVFRYVRISMSCILCARARFCPSLFCFVSFVLFLEAENGA